MGRTRSEKLRDLQKRKEEEELEKRYYEEDWSPSFHDQVKVMEDKVPERLTRRNDAL